MRTLECVYSWTWTKFQTFLELQSPGKEEEYALGLSAFSTTTRKFLTTAVIHPIYLLIGSPISRRRAFIPYALQTLSCIFLRTNSPVYDFCESRKWLHIFPVTDWTARLLKNQSSTGGKYRLGRRSYGIPLFSRFLSGRFSRSIDCLIAGDDRFCHEPDHSKIVMHLPFCCLRLTASCHLLSILILI